MKRPQVYELILWEDPATDWDNWTPISDIQSRPPDLVFTVGWLVREDNTHVYVCMDWSEEKANTVGKIPKAAIKKRKSVKLRGFPPKTRNDKIQQSDEIQQSDIQTT